MKKIKKALLLTMSFMMSASMFVGCSVLDGLLGNSTEDSTPPANSSVEEPNSSVEETPGESETPGTSETS